MVDPELPELDRIYEQRRKNFKKRLINQVNYLGFASIILQYLKFGCSIWIILIRLFVQSLLSSPFPSELQMRRLAISTYSRQIPGLGNVGDSTAEGPSNTSELQMPGAFGPVNTTEQATTENAENTTKKLRSNIAWFLFHCSLTFNCLLILAYIMWPIDFQEKLDDFSIGRKDLGNTPSPFNNGHGLQGGERKGSLFIQPIGERVPCSNFWGNVQVSGFNFLILMCQFGLFNLTCFEDSDAAQDDGRTVPSGPDNSPKNDGYGGNVIAAVINPITAFDKILDNENHEMTYEPGV